MISCPSCAGRKLNPAGCVMSCCATLHGHTASTFTIPLLHSFNSRAYKVNARQEQVQII